VARFSRMHLGSFSQSFFSDGTPLSQTLCPRLRQAGLSSLEPRSLHLILCPPPSPLYFFNLPGFPILNSELYHPLRVFPNGVSLFPLCFRRPESDHVFYPPLASTQFSVPLVSNSFPVFSALDNHLPPASPFPNDYPKPNPPPSAQTLLHLQALLSYFF